MSRSKVDCSSSSCTHAETTVHHYGPGAAVASAHSTIAGKPTGGYTHSHNRNPNSLSKLCVCVGWHVCTGTGCVLANFPRLIMCTCKLSQTNNRTGIMAEAATLACGHGMMFRVLQCVSVYTYVPPLCRLRHSGSFRMLNVCLVGGAKKSLP